MSTKTTKLLSALLIAAPIAFAEAPASAFSTGNHNIATERGLKRAGFDNWGIGWVQAANYNVDNHTNLKDFAMTASGLMQRGKNVALYLHCDDLHARPFLERDLIANDKWLRTIVAEAKGKRDYRAILNGMGIALHALQDFYSHSNFADFDWVAWKGARIVTMEDLPRDLWENPLITTRWAHPTDSKGIFSAWSTSNVHGKPIDPNFPHHQDTWKECNANASAKECGLNHDGARRRNSLVAVLMAAEATYDLVERVRLMVNDPTLWANVQHPGLELGLVFELNRAQALSMAAGQWGYEKDPHDIAVATAWAATHCFNFIGQCQWEDKWRENLFTMFASAPTGHAQSGGGDMFPAMSVPEFALPATTPVPASYAGLYNVSWGMKKGTLTLNTMPNGAIAGELIVENDGPANAPSNTGAPIAGTGSRTYRQTAMWIRNGGLEMSLLTPDTRFTVSGLLYPTGTGPNKDLTGYLRDGVDQGTPDGFVAIRRTGGAGPGPGPNNNSIPPNNLPKGPLR